MITWTKIISKITCHRDLIGNDPNDQKWLEITIWYPQLWTKLMLISPTLDQAHVATIIPHFVQKSTWKIFLPYDYGFLDSASSQSKEFIEMSCKYQRSSNHGLMNENASTKSTQTEEVRNAKHITTKLSTTNVAFYKLPFQKKSSWNQNHHNYLFKKFVKTPYTKKVLSLSKSTRPSWMFTMTPLQMLLGSMKLSWKMTLEAKEDLHHPENDSEANKRSQTRV